MRPRAIAIGATLLAGLITPVARAQSVRFDADPNPAFTVFAATGFDDAVVPLSLGGAVALELEGRPLLIGGAFMMPLLEPGFDDFAFEVFADYDVHEAFGWMVRPRLSLAIQTTSNGVFDGTGLEIGAGVFGGWSDPIWVAGAEVVGRLNIFSHLRASQTGRDFGGLSDDAVLWGNGYVLELGARGGVLLGPVEISLRAGWQRRGDYSQSPPFYASLTIGVRWR